MLGASFAIYTQDHREPKVDDPQGGELQREATKWEIAEVTMDLVRILFLLALISFYALFVLLRANKLKAEAAKARRTAGGPFSYPSHDGVTVRRQTGDGRWAFSTMW